MRIGLLLRTTTRKVPTSVYTRKGSIFIDGLSAADRMVLSVAMQQRCRTLYGEQSDDKYTLSTSLTHTHTHTHNRNLVEDWEGGKQNLPRVLEGKADTLQAWSDPKGSRKLRFSDYMKTAQDGGKVVSLTHRPP